MIRRILLPLLGSGLLLAATAGSAFAKCEGPEPPEFCKDVAVNLNIGGGGGTLQAGIRETVTIDVSLCEQPYDATSVVLTFARVADGDAVVVPATASVRPGLWTADVLLNDGGSWTVVAQVIALDGTETMVPFNTIQVAKAAGPATGQHAGDAAADHPDLADPPDWARARGPRCRGAAGAGDPGAVEAPGRWGAGRERRHRGPRLAAAS